MLFIGIVVFLFAFLNQANTLISAEHLHYAINCGASYYLEDEHSIIYEPVPKIV